MLQSNFSPHRAERRNQACMCLHIHSVRRADGTLGSSAAPRRQREPIYPPTPALSYLGPIQTSTSRATVIDLDLLRLFDLVTVSGEAVNEHLLCRHLDDTQIISLKR